MTTFTKSVGLFLILKMLCLSFPALAQIGQYDVRFNLNNFDCNTNQVFIDIELKANNPTATFLVSDQNYRFSFNRAAISPINPPIGTGGTGEATGHTIQIFEELTYSGFVQENPYFSFFDPHTLTGSLDTIMSYNVRLAGGTGHPVSETDWTKVGRLLVQLNGSSSCFDFTWHTHDPFDFPPTFIGEKFGGSLFATDEGNYENYSLCLETLCGSGLPVELVSFGAREIGCNILVEWETATEINNSHFRLERSLNGGEYEEIARIQGSGNSSTTNYYQFLDEAQALEQYYRLVQVDFDGQETYSDQVLVKSSCFEEEILNGITTLFPNPAYDEAVHMNYYSDRENQEAKIIITDVLGVKRMEMEIEILPGANVMQFDPRGLQPGTYYVKVHGDGWYSDSKKLIKLNP